VVFVADDLGAWLIGLLADAGRKRLTSLVFGSDQERALRKVASAAVQETAVELSSSDEQAGHFAMVISEIFREPMPHPALGEPMTMLEGLQAGIARQLTVLDDASQTGTGQSSAEILGVPGAVLAEKLTGYLVQTIMVRGSEGGPLAPLADQLNHDLTRLQGQRIEGMLAQLVTVVTTAHEPTDAEGLARGGALPSSHSGAEAAGRPLDEVSDPFAVEVHRPVHMENQPSGLTILPRYMPREHDTKLRSVVQAAVQGRSGLAVLVGGSSTGKTRACWEVLQLLRQQPKQWRLWHPIDPSRPDAALRDLPRIGRRTVVWLNEAQYYLAVTNGGLGERVAAGLREVLRDPARAPVLILATLWPSFWDRLTADPAGEHEPHAQAREFLSGHDIAVPAALTTAQIQQLTEMGDVRLAAAAAAPDGEAIQYLAGAPELLSQYHNAPPAARALIQAAMDARRLGMRPALPQAFLEAAAPGYLTDSEWHLLPENWMEEGLEYTGKPCKGVRGPLTRARPRPGRWAQSPDDFSPRPNDGVAYRLADFLDQTGHRSRRDKIPPESFWTAAAAHAYPGDLADLGQEAASRGLYRDAAQLWKIATAHSNAQPTTDLIYILEDLYPTDQRPANWVAANIALHDLTPAIWPFASFRRLDAKQALLTLIDRVVTQGPLNDPRAVSELLEELQEMGAKEHLTRLLARNPARHASIGDPYDWTRLLDELVNVNAQSQAHLLAHRAATDTTLDDPAAVATVLNFLRKRGGLLGHASALLTRDPARHASLSDVGAVAKLIDSLREADAQDQVIKLAERAVPAVPLDNARDVAHLVGALHRARAAQQLTALLSREPARHVPVDDAGALVTLLGWLRRAGASDQVDLLLSRDPAAHVSFYWPDAGIALLGELKEIGAREQFDKLTDRFIAAPLYVTTNKYILLTELRKIGLYSKLLNLDPLTINDLRAMARLLELLLEEGGMEERVTALADHAAAAPVESPRDVAFLLYSLYRANTSTQAITLSSRAAAATPLNDPGAIATLLKTMWNAGDQEQVAVLLSRSPATQASLTKSYDVSRLLEELQQVNAQEQVSMLMDRLPGEGLFEIWVQEDHRERFRFGREADGRPAKPWKWDDLNSCVPL
jgi:hypothetical protein